MLGECTNVKELTWIGEFLPHAGGAQPVQGVCGLPGAHGGARRRLRALQVLPHDGACCLKALRTKTQKPQYCVQTPA